MRRGWRGLGALALMLGVATAGCATFRGAPPALAGKVVQAETDRPLPGVLVLLEDGSRSWTNKRGEYRFRDLEPGRYDALVIDRGCRSAQVEVVRSEGETTRADIRIDLPPPATHPGAVPPPEESRGRVLTAAEIEASGAARLSDAIRQVAPEMIGAEAGEPGQASSLRGRGSPSVSGNRVPILVVDGIVIHAVDTSSLNQIALRDVAWIEVLPGAVSGWEYGTGGSGGVIRIQTKQGYHPEDDLSPEHCTLPEGWEYGEVVR